MNRYSQEEMDRYLKKEIYFTKEGNELSLRYEDGKECYAIAEFKQRYPQKTLIVPDAWNGIPIRTVSPYGFSGTDLEIIQLSDNIETLETCAFDVNKNLQTLIIGKNVKKIYPAFSFHTKFKHIELEKDNKNLILNDGMLICGKELITHEYAGKKKLFIPEGVTDVLAGAFRNDDDVESVIMPDTLIRIGNAAFKRCVNLNNIKFSKNLIEIGDYVFEDTNIKNAILPKSLEDTGEDIFWGCPNLRFLDLSQTKITCIRNYVRECPNIKSLYLPNTIIDSQGWDDEQKYNIYCRANSKTDKTIKNRKDLFKYQNVKYIEKTLNVFLDEINTERDGAK